MANLINKVKEALTFYREHFPTGSPIKKVMLCGGGANFKAVDTYIAKELKLPVETGNPWCNLSVNPSRLPSAEFLSLTTAIGLALRTFYVPPQLWLRLIYSHR